ncbi:MAG TPA: thiolase family protein [Streptosporangiaceae bacterium]|nr:thiolase family protein [Streptosporangiaceae bacterium]
MAKLTDAVIVDAVRSPIGKAKPGGEHTGTHPVDLLARTLKALTDRTRVDPGDVDDVIGGCVDQVGEQAMNTTRWAVLAAGFPETVPATTVDRQCGSSQQAAHFAAQGMISGAYDIAIACGVESMSRVPMWSSVPPGTDPFGPSIAKRYEDGLVPQGISAELVAAKWHLSRTEQDDFAARSHQRAAAHDFTAELAWPGRDESIRPDTTTQKLAALKPAFYDEGFARRFPQIGWHITAGNSSPLNDGATAVMIMSSEKAAQLGLRPMARLHSFAVAADDPVLMLTAIIPATAKVLARAGLSVADIGLFEVNEAFASVVLAWLRETGADPAKVNVNGGAIAIGHPLGASGTRLMTTLVHEMRARGARWGLQTMCEAGGLANATVLELL